MCIASVGKIQTDQLGGEVFQLVFMDVLLVRRLFGQFHCHVDFFDMAIIFLNHLAKSLLDLIFFLWLIFLLFLNVSHLRIRILNFILIIYLILILVLNTSSSRIYIL